MRAVAKIIPHTGYNHPIANDNDIALLQLSQPLDFNDNVSPICLATSEADDAPVGTMCTVTGWGTTSSKPIQLALYIFVSLLK